MVAIHTTAHIATKKGINHGPTTKARSQAERHRTGADTGPPLLPAVEGKVKRTYINHKDHGHPITGPEGKVARAKCRKDFPGGVGAPRKEGDK